MTCNPFVPFCNENKLRVKLEGSVPLLLEIVAVKLGGVRKLCVLILVGVASAENVFAVKCGKTALGVCILRNTYGHIFAAVFFAFAEGVLRVNLKPGPLLVI